MRPTRLTKGAAGFTAWCPMDYGQNAFGVSLGAIVTSGASLTYKVQHSFDSPYDLVPFYATRTTTTVTATIPDHQLTAGDMVNVVGAGAPMDGSYAVASVSDANTITYTVANSGVTLSKPGANVNLMHVFDNSVITGKTANADSHYAFPVTAIRVNVTSYTSGKVTLTIIQSSPGGH